MARSWSKDRDRTLARRAASAAHDEALIFDAPESGPSKAELRAQAEAALASYRGPVTRLPTIVELRCACGHRGKARVHDSQRGLRFKCSRCGARL